MFKRNYSQIEISLRKKIEILKEGEKLIYEKLIKTENKEIITRKHNFKLAKEIKKLQNQIKKLIKGDKNKMKLITIHDKRAEKHGNVYTEVNTAVAIRAFAEACQNPKSPMGMFPDDMELCLVGEYDEITGIITPQPPAVIAKATDYVRKEDK